MKHQLKYSRQQLYQSCLLSMCVHIAAIPRLSYISHENSWDKCNYSFQDKFSTDGTISFDTINDVIVGAFRNNTSVRMNEYPTKIAMDLFAEANDDVRVIAQNETLMYLRMSFEHKKGFIFANKSDIIVPVVTTALWSEGDKIFSSDNESVFLENGGEYINKICVSKDELIEYLTDDYELTDDEISFAEELFLIKISEKVQLVRTSFSDFINFQSEGYEEFISALLNFGIEVV